MFYSAYIGNVGHDGILIIGRQVVVAGDGGDRVEGGKVILAILVVCGCSRDVGVVGFRDLKGIRPGRGLNRTCPKSWM